MLKPVVLFCSQCGASVEHAVPPGDNRLRDICNHCGKIHYQNPRIVVGTLPVYRNKILLCKRAIEPRKGYWTLPGGFMELDETLEQAATRETMEEAMADVQLQSLYTVFNVLSAGQVSIFFLATMDAPEFFPGEESEEVHLFSEESIPWSELAFSTITETLKYFFEDRKSGDYPLHMDTAL